MSKLRDGDNIDPGAISRRNLIKVLLCFTGPSGSMTPILLVLRIEYRLTRISRSYYTLNIYLCILCIMVSLIYCHVNQNIWRRNFKEDNQSKPNRCYHNCLFRYKCEINKNKHIYWIFIYAGRIFFMKIELFDRFRRVENEKLRQNNGILVKNRKGTSM